MQEEKNPNSLPSMSEEKTQKAKNDTSENVFADFDFSKLILTPEELLKAGVHFGHQKSRKNPKMDGHIFTTRRGINIIDLKSTQARLAEAMAFAKKVIIGGKQVLFVGTKKQAHDIIVSAAELASMPYVVNRWLGGTFTNYKVINGRVKYMEEGEGKMERGEFKKYTKLEQSKKREELKKLNERLGGLRRMKELPGAVFVVDLKEDLLPIREAQKLNIPVIGIADTNADPNLVEYPIPGNDDAVSSIRIITAFILKAIINKNN
jgi:small subunit ribosomal protein S2